MSEEILVPLEYEPSAALAYGLTTSRFWEFERRRFLSGDEGTVENFQELRKLGYFIP